MSVIDSSMTNKTVSIKVGSINDIARFAGSLVTLGQPVYVLRFKKGDKTIYGLLAVFRDFYKYYGLPIFYYVELSGEHDDKNYILLRSDERGEKLEFAKTTRPGVVAIPIITLKEIPPFINV